MNTKRLILASGSPRRKELLQQAGFTFEVITSSAEESYSPGMPPSEVAPYLASLKAGAVADALGMPSDCAIIGADTVVALGNHIYGKPTDEQDACAILGQLSAKTHQVVTGVCVICENEKLCFAQTTDVTFKPLSPDEIASYVETKEPMDKAGAYGIQGLGAALVECINGDYNNVVGLPVDRLTPILEYVLENGCLPAQEQPA